MRPGFTKAAALLALWVPLAAEGADEKSPLKPSQIAAGVQPALPAIKECYTAATARKPSLAGQLDMTWVVKADGTVSSPKVVDSSTAREPEFETCVLGVLKKAKFPKPGKKVIVNYPFTFASKTVNPEEKEHLSPDAEGARQVLFENKQALLDCFGPEGKRDRDARVHVAFRIFAGGYSGDVTFDDQPTPEKKAIAECLAGRIKDFRFKSPESGTAGLTVPFSVVFLEQSSPPR